jgi:hypothetical protein
MKFIIASAIMALLTLHGYNIHAQDRPNFPTELKTKEDYAKYEPLVKETADWLEETDLDKQPDIRLEANAFIVKWLAGSPTVTITVESHLMKLVDKNPLLIPIYMARYSSYCITNNAYKDELEPTKAGLQAIVKVYKKGIGITKDKTLEKLSKAIDQQQLDEYVAKNLKQSK